MEPRGTELITRYKRIYGFSEESEIDKKMILQHWELEKKSTKEILESSSENRWEVCDRAYTQLYCELRWLNETIQDTKSPVEKYQTWLATIGSRAKKIYEVGSEKGELIRYLATCELECKGTGITTERGEKHVNDLSSYLSWGNSDGIHLEQFEPAEFYDVGISNQVIEHFHPEDLNTHFKSVHTILNENGRYIAILNDFSDQNGLKALRSNKLILQLISDCYIFSTPHFHTGPHDVSLVFKVDANCREFSLSGQK